MKQLTTPDNLLKKTATADLVQTAPKTVEKAEIVAARDDIRADGSAVKDNFVLTDFTVILISYGDKKVSVTTAVREITNLGLKESKDLVDAAPKAVKENISRDEANTVVEKLTSAGATVEVRASGLVRPNVSTHVRTLFDVILIACGEKKVEVIKVVRQITGLGLKESKDLVDAAPKAVKENIPRDEAEAAAAMLTDAGATVEIR